MTTNKKRLIQLLTDEIYDDCQDTNNITSSELKEIKGGFAVILSEEIEQAEEAEELDTVEDNELDPTDDNPEED